jgi:hypothetical protein
LYQHKASVSRAVFQIFAFFCNFQFPPPHAPGTTSTAKTRKHKARSADFRAAAPAEAGLGTDALATDDGDAA